MNAREVAEPLNLKTTRWLQQMAAQKNAVVTGSFIVKEGEQYFNRLLWVQPNGEFTHYDKRHLR